MKILSNQLRCHKCGDTPYSAHRHDFRYCKCGAVAVDGGMDYLGRGGGFDDCTEMSITITDELYNSIADAITDPERNELGKVCNLVRVLRDELGVNIGEVEQDE